MENIQAKKQDNIKSFMEILKKDLKKDLNKIFEKHIEDLKNMQVVDKENK